MFSIAITVVNWFQFVFLREDSQAGLEITNNEPSCELISICIFTWGFTRVSPFSLLWSSLWIDFNLYFYVRIHKNLVIFIAGNSVVNWFQFVFLREDSQVSHISLYIKSCCELISICIFTWGFTSVYPHMNSMGGLWIDFNLYFYVRIHKQDS